MKDYEWNSCPSGHSLWLLYCVSFTILLGPELLLVLQSTEQKTWLPFLSF